MSGRARATSGKETHRDRTGRDHDVEPLSERHALSSPPGLTLKHMGDDLQTSVSFPLDSDGFLRRACPNCGRELKWHMSLPDDPGTIPVPDGGYHCPYCNKQAPPSEWLTEEQARHAEQVAARDLAQPFMQKKAEELGMNFEPGPPIEVEPLAPEPSDMSVFTFPCHPVEPIKYDADWSRPLHCIICGQQASLRA